MARGYHIEEHKTCYIQKADQSRALKLLLEEGYYKKEYIVSR